MDTANPGIAYKMNDPVNNNIVANKIWNRVNAIDWRLLAFLLLFLNVKLIVKLAAIVLIYILRPDFKFGFRLKDSRVPLFYLFVMAIAAFNWIFSGLTMQLNYILVFLSGLSFWLLCILAIHQVKLSVEKNDIAVLHQTLLVFFLINAAVSLIVYTGIIIETGHINPFRYQGNFQKYFIGTGDYIKGITLDTSNTNATINAFGIIYYLLRKKYLMVLLCMLVLLLTGSNVTNLALCLVLLYLFIFKTNKDQKSIIVVCLVMLIVFLIQVSPQNNKYIKTLYQRISKDIPREKPVYLDVIPITQKPDSILTPDQRKQKIAQLYLDSMNGVIINNEMNVSANDKKPELVVKFIEKPVIPKDSIHTPTFQHKKDTTVVEKKLLNLVKELPATDTLTINRKVKTHIPGKLLALLQTGEYFTHHPLQLLTGLGIGNFSSKLAFRATAMNIAGGYPAKYSYISKAFRSNHLDLYIFYFTTWDDLHSMANSPNCTYDQLASEYGIAGLFCFAFFYLRFFFRRLKNWSYGLPILILMCALFFTDYWFEQLSVVIFFELLLFLNIKEIAEKPTNENS